MNTVWVGNASVVVTPRAVNGPAFATVMRYVKVRPGVTTGSTTVLVIETSALAVPTTGMAGALVLLPGVGSGVGELTVARFSMPLPLPV